MKHYSLLTAVATLALFTASCGKEESSGVESSSGGSVAADTSAGNSGGSGDTAGSSATSETGSTTVAGGSSNAGASSGTMTSDGAGGVVGSTTIGKSDLGGGTSVASTGAGGATANTSQPNTNATGGDKGSTGGAKGSGGTKGAAGGTTGFAKGGSTGAGGKTLAGGASGAGASNTGGRSGVGGATTSTSAPGTTPSVGCGKMTTLKSGRASIEVPNVTDSTREYILALPSNYDPSHPYKLIFAWHPWMGSAQMISNGGYYGLQKESNNEAIFVAGEGLNFTQNGQSGLGWGNADGEDIAFYHAMLDLFRNELCIDEDRIFSAGFSFGAMFSFTLGCTAESMTRAIIPMAGNTFTSGGCENGTRSVAVMSFIGLQDSLLDGHRQAVSTYAKRDGCTTTTETMNPSWCDGLSSTNLPCTCVNYQGCKDGYPVVACEYTAGHQQAPNPGPIWDFIAQF